jgi:hemin uptake protein HemP
MTADEANSDSPATGPPNPAPIIEPRVVRSEELFAGHKTIVIRHGTENYRLLITRNDRLILQK